MSSIGLFLNKIQHFERIEPLKPFEQHNNKQ